MAESGLVTVLFTDLVGSTELSERIGDGAADDLRRLHFESLRSVIATTGGDEVKTIGDAMMVTYRGAADAIAGAVGMQQAVERDNRAGGATGHADRDQRRRRHLRGRGLVRPARDRGLPPVRRGRGRPDPGRGHRQGPGRVPGGSRAGVGGGARPEGPAGARRRRRGPLGAGVGWRRCRGRVHRGAAGPAGTRRRLLLRGSGGDLHLARMARDLGRYDEAEAHCAASVDLCERAGAPTFLAHTKDAWAEILIDRGGDPDRARALASEALATAEDLGVARLAETATRHLTALA